MRGRALADSMSQYLVDRIKGLANVEVVLGDVRDADATTTRGQTFRLTIPSSSG